MPRAGESAAQPDLGRSAPISASGMPSARARKNQWKYAVAIARSTFSNMCSVGTMSSTASARDRLGVIQRHAVSDAAAAVVSGDGEALVAERAHQRELVAGHLALGVVRRRAALPESP